MLKTGDPIWIRDGRTLRLGKKVGQGGEGTVYELEGEPKLVAKIYTERLKSSHQHKIDALIGLAQPNLREMAAWPSMIVRAPDKGATIGFVMPKLEGFRAIHDLYTPGSRRTRFPEYDFGELLKVGHNLSAAFHRVHQSGCIVGDVNEGNIFVGKAAAVRLIDCDSFQVPAANGIPFFCEVGVPGFTPPELQGQVEFDKIPRTKNHDAFGLAVLLFHLIFLGRHPFAGRPTIGRDFAIEEAIKEHRFAYGRGASSRGLSPPLNVPDLDLVGPLLAKMFEFSFLPAPRDRPRPDEWAVALRALHQNLKICSDEPGHQYPNHLATCPWCIVEQATSLILFPLRDQSTGAVNSAFDIDRFERELNSINLSHLAVPPVIDPLPNAHSRPRFKIVQASTLSSAALLVVAALYSGLATRLSPAGGLIAFVAFVAVAYRALPTYLSMRMRALTKIQAEIDKIIATMIGEIAAADVDKRKEAFKSLIRDYRNLPNLLQSKITERNKQARDIQFQHHMSSFSIRDYKIPNFGQTRKSSLAAVNIVTAWDIHQAKYIPNVRGIGPGLWADVQAWANQFVSTFLFDSRRAMPPDALLGIKREVQQRRRILENELNKGFSGLQALRNTFAAKREQGLEKIRGLVASRTVEALKLEWWLK